MLRNKFGDHLSMLGNDDRLSIFVNLIYEIEAFGFKFSHGNGHRMTGNSYWSFSQGFLAIPFSPLSFFPRFVACFAGSLSKRQTEDASLTTLFAGDPVELAKNFAF
jgi:hypothetical protein